MPYAGDYLSTYCTKHIFDSPSYDVEVVRKDVLRNLVHENKYIQVRAIVMWFLANVPRVQREEVCLWPLRRPRDVGFCG